MTKRIKDPLGCAFPEGFEVGPEHEVVDPHPEPRRPKARALLVPVPAGALVPTLTPTGQDYLHSYYQWKLTAACPRCGERRFQNLLDVGAGYGPPGCQLGICAPCGEDLKSRRPRRKRLATWEGA